MTSLVQNLGKQLNQVALVRPFTESVYMGMKITEIGVALTKMATHGLIHLATERGESSQPHKLAVSEIFTDWGDKLCPVSQELLLSAVKIGVSVLTVLAQTAIIGGVAAVATLVIAGTITAPWAMALAAGVALVALPIISSVYTAGLETLDNWNVPNDGDLVENPYKHSVE